jgi:hypothetical protein
MVKSDKVFVGIDGKLVELIGADKEAFIAQQEADKAERALLEAKYEARKQQKLTILERIGLTEEELQIVLGA